jgi:hypothetical protein
VCTNDVCDGAGLCYHLPNVAPCDDDGNVCTDDVCRAGLCQHLLNTARCDDGDPCTRDTCNPITGCQNDAVPATGCRAAEKSSLLIENNTDDTKDKLTWKWLKGAGTTLSQLGDPTSTTKYALCLYAGSASASVTMPAGSGWRSAAGAQGFTFKDSSGTVVLKSGGAGHAKALIKAKGTNLPDNLTGVLSLPVTAQLVNDTNSTCFETVYDAPEVVKNDGTQFKAKH